MNRNFTKMILVPVLLLFSIGGYAQTTISGNVSDESGEGLIGVNVLVELINREAIKVQRIVPTRASILQ